MNIEPIPLAGILAGAVLYFLGMQRLAEKGRRWPRRRAAAFAGFLAAIAVALVSPLESQDTRLFSAHVVQHLFLSMVAPIFFWLSAPITLLLQASDRAWQQRTLKVLHSRVMRVVTFPVVSFGLFVVTLFILFFTGLYDLSLRNSTFHLLVHLHYLAVGCLFFAPVVAIDPHPWRMPHGARMLYVGLTLPAHAFLALALMSATTPLSLQWYATTTGRTASAILSDQKLGAGIMWVTGDLLAIATVAVVVIQWVKFDERSASREDRALDRAEAEASQTAEARFGVRPGD